MMWPICGIGRGEACSGRTESLYEGECSLATREMCSRVKGWSEPVPEPPTGVAVVKQCPFNLNR